MKRRKSETVTRSYEGASPAARRFGGGGASFGTWNSEGSAARIPLQNRARHFHENNPLAHSGVSAWTTAAIGAGIMATSQHPDPEMRKLLDATFKEWTTRSDVEGLTDFYGQQAAGVKSERIDGEAIFRWVGDQLQQIPADMLDTAMTRELNGGSLIANGIELDSFGRRVAYYINPAKPTDLYPTYSQPVRIPAEDVLHIFKPTGPGAVRGISALSNVLLRLSELDATEDALQTNVKVAALLSVILTNENDVGSGEDPFADGQSLEPGAMFKVPGGWKVNSTAPQQAQQVTEYLGHMTRTIAAGLDVPEHLLTGDLRQTNYSSLRAGLVSFRQKIEQYQFQTLVPQMLNPAWRRVITNAILNGKIEANDFEHNPDAYFAVEWIPPAQPHVDPVKDAQAIKLLMDEGLMSRRQAVAGQGYSIDELDQEIAADKQREEALQISFGEGD